MKEYLGALLQRVENGEFLDDEYSPNVIPVLKKLQHNFNLTDLSDDDFNKLIENENKSGPVKLFKAKYAEYNDLIEQERLHRQRAFEEKFIANFRSRSHEEPQPRKPTCMVM
jgi:hypothetical protein